MVEIRPTCEEMLEGIGYWPLACPDSVPAEVRETDDREPQGCLVACVQGLRDHVTAYAAEHGHHREHGRRYGCMIVDIDPAGDIGGLMTSWRPVMDEVRVSGRVRSADGISADYAGHRASSAFLTVGADEACSATTRGRAIIW